MAACHLQSPIVSHSLHLSRPAHCSSSSSTPHCAASCTIYSFPRLFLSSSSSFSSSSLSHGFASSIRNPLSVRAVAEVEEAPAPAPAATDGLTMNLKVEGTIADSLIPKVEAALKNIQGISSSNVTASEGLVFIEVAKQTNIQATGEASALLEIIRGEGFKVINLGISFDDIDADGDEIVYEYESTS